MINLIRKSLKDKLEMLRMIDEIYKSKLDNLEGKHNEINSNFEALISELVTI